MTEEPRFEVAFAPETDDELSALGASNRVLVLKAILKKLCVAPRDYGQPLRRDLSGYLKLRVGRFRVVYHVADELAYVLVLSIGKRAAGEAEGELTPAWP